MNTNEIAKELQLPEPVSHGHIGDGLEMVYLYTKEQMLEYAAKAVRFDRDFRAMRNKPEYWEMEALRYAQNAEFWKAKAEQYECATKEAQA